MSNKGVQLLMQKIEGDQDLIWVGNKMERKRGCNKINAFQ